MKELSTMIVDDERMTSLQIAEITGKPHADVMKAIRKMEPAWSKINEGNFSLVEYKDKKGGTRPCYSLNKERGQWILYAQFLKGGYVHSRAVDIIRKDGRHDVKYNTEWTTKGRIFLYEALKGKGILPLIEQENTPGDKGTGGR